MKKVVHYVPAYLHNPPHPVTVLLVGCGGTGSLVAARLARLDYVLRKLEHPGLHVVAFDGDIVEEHNVGRQNFTMADIGRPKASSMIEKINFAFGLSWEAVNQNFDGGASCNIIITCVDKVDIRKKIHDSIGRKHNGSEVYYPLYWIDCGNGKNFGQVVVATFKEIPQPKKSQYNCVGKLRSVIDIFGDLEQFDTEETQGIESCSMAESLEKQNLFINDAIAVQAVLFLEKILRSLYLTYNGTSIRQDTFQCVGFPIVAPAPKKRASRKSQSHGLA